MHRGIGYFIGVATLGLIVIVSTISLRDKEIVLKIPDKKPLTAEAALPSEEPSQAGALETGTAPIGGPVTSGSGTGSGDSRYYYSPPSPEIANLFETPVQTEPSPLTQIASKDTSAATSTTSEGRPTQAETAISPTTVYYGLGAVVVNPSSETTGATSTETSTTSTTSTSSQDSTTPPPTQESTNPVFITELIPNSGIGGLEIIIQGLGFSTNSQEDIVKFDSAQSNSTGVTSSNQIRATVPAGLASGFKDLSVSVNGSISNILAFDVLKPTPSQVFIDETQNRLPNGLAIGDSAILKPCDIDGDKDLDLIIIDSTNQAAYLLVNNGNGSFANESSARLPVISNLEAATDSAFGDINGDSSIDILLSFAAGQSVKLLLNDGTGVFSEATSAKLPSVATEAVSLDLGDVDGDGDLDIVIANKDDKDALLINDGTGVFTQDATFSLPDVIDHSSDVEFLDIDGDGDLDIITTNDDIVAESSLRNRVYVNDGSGNFADGTLNYLPQDNEYSERLDFGDVDGDGDLDLIVANYTQDSVLLNNGSGVFQDGSLGRLPTNSFASKDSKLGDVDGDGDLDIVMLGEDKCTLLVNDSTGKFEDTSIKLPSYNQMPAPIGGKSIELADIDGDGDLDIIVGGETLRILINGTSNKPPILDTIGNKTVEVGRTLTFNVTAEDPNGDSLSYFISGLPSGAAFASQLFSWSPTSGDIGVHGGIRFLVQEDTVDALEDSETIAIEVTASNLPRIGSYTPATLDLNLTSGQIVQFGVSATNPLQGQLRFTWIFNGAEIPAINDASSSFILIVPRIGENTVSVRVTNSAGSVSLEWHLTVTGVANEPPEIVSSSPTGTVVSLDLTEGGALNFAVTASDPENDTLAYVWKFNGELLPNAAGATWDATAYVGNVTPGNYIVKVEVSDGHNSPVTREWTLQVTQSNAPPRIVSSSPTGAEVSIDLTEGGALNFAVTASDPENDPLTYAWKFNGEPLPNATGATWDATAYVGNITLGNYIVKVEISDGHNSPVTREWTLQVTQTTVDETALFLNELAKRSFFYFRDEMNPQNGLIRDRVKVDGLSSPYDSIASVATTGFGLTALCIGVEKGWIDRALAQDLALTIINTFIEIQNNQAGDPAGYGRSGFFYHFLDINTKERTNNNSEVSTIDTAILIAGALTAGEYFGGEVKTKAETLYSNVDWAAFLDTREGENHNLFHMAWSPESGFSTSHWNYYSEGLLIYLLAVGSPSHPVDADIYYTFRRELGKYGDNGLPLIKTWFGSLFTYQYPHAWFDFRSLRDAQNVYWFKNTIDATIANRQYCIDNSIDYGYGENFWGLSASDGPSSGYVEYGAPPLGASEPISDGTVSPAASAGSLPMNDDIVIPNLLNIYDTYKDNVKVWERYGFTDSINLKPGQEPWYASYYVGIDVGITLLMVENYRTGFVWNNFMLNQHIQDAKARIGFTADPVYTYVDREPLNSFVSILLAQDKPTQEIIYDIETLQNSEYLLVLQPFGMDNKGSSSYVNVAISINDADQGMVTFRDSEGQGIRNIPNIYKTIDSSLLIQGKNRIVLTWQDGESWVSLKKIEIKSPRNAINIWAIGQPNGSYAEFGDEWKIDDTYYVSEPYNTFEKALNINNEAFTDILFYVDDLAYDRELILNSLESQGQVSVGIEANGNVLQNAVWMGPNQTQRITVPANKLREGWNYLRIMHANQAGSGEWISWDSLELVAKESELAPPAGFVGASFGPDKINLRWERSTVSGVDGYNIYRSATPGGPYVRINTTLIATSSSQDTGLQDRTTYYYVITAVDRDATPSESRHSSEIAITSGDYELDYGDGREPNAFGGTSSSHWSYLSMIKHDWNSGYVRKVILNPAEEGSLTLNGVDLSQASILSMWIKGNGGEKVDIGLKGTASGESVVSVTVADGWQNLRLRLSDFSGISFSNMEKLFIRSSASSGIILYLDDIVFVRETPGAFSLDITPKQISDNARASGISFDNLSGSEYAPAKQYIEVKYGISAENWKIWIYTKNDNGDPQYLEGQFNGLMASDGRQRIPLIWRVYPDVQQGGVPCRTRSDVYSGDSLTWNYIKDTNDSDWASANQPGQEYSVTAYGSFTWAHLASVPPGLGDRDPINSTFYVYIGSILTAASAGDYSTTIYFDLTHE